MRYVCDVCGAMVTDQSYSETGKLLADDGLEIVRTSQNALRFDWELRHRYSGAPVRLPSRLAITARHTHL